MEDKAAYQELEPRTDNSLSSKKANMKNMFKIDWKNYTSFAGLVILLIISAILSPTFLNSSNIMNVLLQISAPGLLAIGMTFIILTAGIDLSVGSVVALIGVLIAVLSPIMNAPVTILLVIAIGVLIGAFHGLTITRFGVPAFIVTLAGLTAYRGLALITTSSAAVPVSSETLSYLGSGKINVTLALIILLAITTVILVNIISTLNKYEPAAKIKKITMTVLAIGGVAVFGYLIFQTGGLSVQILIFITMFIISWFMLNKTVFGRKVYAVGGNQEASRLAGLRVNNVLMKVYMFAGFLTAVAGIMVVSRLGSGTPQVAQLWELDAIAAVVIGGTSLMGGVGRLGGTLIGVLLIGVLNNLLSLLNVSSDMTMVFKGIIILGAVIIDTNFSKK